MTKLMRNPLDRYVKPIGTFFSKFRLGRYGPYIGARGDDVSTFASSGRDDSLDPGVAYAAIRAWALKLFGGGVVFNAGAKGAGSDWSVEVTWPQTGLTENIRIILPSNTPSPGDALTVLTYLAGAITLEWAPGGGGGVSSVTSGDLIDVDNTDPLNPIVNVDDSLKTGTIYVEFDTGPTLGGNFSKPMMSPYDGTITQADIYAGVGQTGNAVIDVYKSTYATWPALTSITGASPPTLTGSSKATDTVLTGWTTAVSIGDLFVFELASYAGLTQVTCTLSVAKS